MTQPRMDDNDKARFLEATMPEEERARAVAHLSASDEDAEDVGDAAYLLRELEAEQGVLVDDADQETDVVLADVRVEPKTVVDGDEAKVIPLRPPSTQRARRRVPAQWLALAAVLAGVLLVPLALSRSGSRGIGEPSQFTAQLANPGAGLSPDWGHPWSGTRGGSAGSEIDNSVAVEIGALHVDLEVAVAARQVEQTKWISARIPTFLEDIPGSGGLEQIYKQIGSNAGKPAEEQAQLLREAEETVAEFLQHDIHFTLGAWAEAARLAAANGDTAFFAAKRSRDALARFTRSGDVAPPTRAAAQEVQAQLERAGRLDWPLLTEKLNALLVAAEQPMID